MRYLFSQINKINQELKNNLLKAAIVILMLGAIWWLSRNILLTMALLPALSFLFFRWETRIYIAAGLLFLVFCPFLLAAGQEAQAEKMAEYAFYMLSLGVLMMILEEIVMGIQRRRAGR